MKKIGFSFLLLLGVSTFLLGYESQAQPSTDRCSALRSGRVVIETAGNQRVEVRKVIRCKIHELSGSTPGDHRAKIEALVVLELEGTRSLSLIVAENSTDEVGLRLLFQYDFESRSEGEDEDEDPPAFEIPKFHLQFSRYGSRLDLNNFRLTIGTGQEAMSEDWSLERNGVIPGVRLQVPFYRLKSSAP